MVSVEWSNFAGNRPDYFNPYEVTYPVAPESTWASGGAAQWPEGSGPNVGQLYVVGSDDLSDYEPTVDRLIFGFRDGEQVTEMNAHSYAVLWEEQDDGLLTLNIMPASLWVSTSPIATITDLDPNQIPIMVQSWASTNNHFQDDLMASLYSLDPASTWPDNHLAIQTHLAGKVTTYDFDQMQAQHGDNLILNFVVMTGRELHMVYDEASQTLTISHFGADWGGYNDVWGKTAIVGATPQELDQLQQLWRFDAAVEDGDKLEDRFNRGLDELVATIPEPPPEEELPDLSVNNRRVEEGEGNVLRFRVDLSEVSDQTVSVAYTTQQSTAKAGSDFVAESGILTFAAGETSQFVEVAIVNDAIQEEEERVLFKLTNAEGANILDGVASGWIEDDDQGGSDQPEVFVNNRRTEEAEGASLTFRIELSEAAGSDVTLTYATRDSTAKAGSDYLPVSGNVVIPSGQLQAAVTVDLVNDAIAEGEERFIFEILKAEGATITDALALGWIDDSDSDAGETSPQVDISAPTVVEGDPGGSGTQLIAGGPLTTSGNQILDSTGTPVEIRAVNWFGLETDIETPHGLWTRNLEDMMDQMKAEGFNAIRLPFSTQVILDGGTPSGIDFFQNPELEGLSGLEIMDRVIDYAGEVGLKVLLDHHRSEAGNSANESGLWYQGAYDQSDWIEAWTTLAARYDGDNTVIGADLHNEPHGPATWGDGGSFDWKAAAELAGNAIHDVNSDWLIVVEGIETYQDNYYWWGGNLQGVSDHPVELEQGGKLVYSPHDYPASVFAQPWFFDGSDLYQVFDGTWGYIYREEIAPILVGEFGSRLETEVDRAWAEAIVNYLDGDFDGDGTRDIPADQAGMSWAWWSWNPNSVDTGGILEDDWSTIRQNAIEVLEPLLATDDEGGESNVAFANFEVTLDEASTEELVFQIRTEDGTATAGDDYEPLSSELSFASGDTNKTVSVAVLPDLEAEGDEFFSLIVEDPEGNEVTAIATILGDDGGSGDDDDDGNGDGGEDDPPATGDDYALDIDVVNDWGNGAQLAVTLTNESGTAVNGWALGMDLPFEIGDIWEAEIAAVNGDRYLFDEAPWNATLQSGQSVSFGFVATDGGIDVASLLDEADIEVFFGW